MFLYPLAISLIILGLLSPLFHHRQMVFVVTTACTFMISIADLFNALPPSFKDQKAIQGILDFYRATVPFFNLGMGWVVPLLLGLSVSWVLSFVLKPSNKGK
jgi:LIVCS family branched-chain amino acid:cation transporter